jgi:hypothetical protein
MSFQFSSSKMHFPNFFPQLLDLQFIGIYFLMIVIELFSFCCAFHHWCYLVHCCVHFLI